MEKLPRYYNQANEEQEENDGQGQYEEENDDMNE